MVARRRGIDSNYASLGNLLKDSTSASIYALIANVESPGLALICINSISIWNDQGRLTDTNSFVWKTL